MLSHERNKNSIAIHIVSAADYEGWLKDQPVSTKNWIENTCFQPKPHAFSYVPLAEGGLGFVLLINENNNDFWALGALPKKLPEGFYHLESHLDKRQTFLALLAWELGFYQFTRYKKDTEQKSLVLSVPEGIQTEDILKHKEAIDLARDLINTPAEDLGPAELTQAIKDIASSFQGQTTEIIGKDLLKQNFPAVYAVGKGASAGNEPRIIKLTWGNKKNPAVSIVGKGVCFDTGGLNLKLGDGMRAMKKDMSGAAHAIALAQLVMAYKLPVYLTLIIPAVENAISETAYRPSDVTQTRQGLTVEIKNTDAEGRVILCDALAWAAEDNPDLIVDYASLTGAARVALGTDLAAFYCNNEHVSDDIMSQNKSWCDNLWPMPLYQDYKKSLDSDIADISNCVIGGYGGSITAALYLQYFIPEKQDWVHLDIYGSNDKKRAGRPVGGHVESIHALYGYLNERYASSRTT